MCNVFLLDHGQQRTATFNQTGKWRSRIAVFGNFHELTGFIFSKSKSVTFFTHNGTVKLIISKCCLQNNNFIGYILGKRV